MQTLRRLFRFYINSSIHVALAVLSLALITYWELNKTPAFSLVLFLFLCTISGYNFVKYARVAGLHHRSLTNSLKSIQIFSGLCSIVAIYFAFMIDWKILGATVFFGLLTFLYAFPVFGKKNFRTFSGVKIFLVGIVWAGVTTIVPFLDISEEMNMDRWLTFFQRFFIVIVLTLPFEIRDLPYDKPQLRTLPQILGIGRTKMMGVILLLSCIAMEYFKDELNFRHTVSLFAMCILSAIALSGSDRARSPYYASFWVEAIPIFGAGLFLLLKFYFESS